MDGCAGGLWLRLSRHLSDYNMREFCRTHGYGLWSMVYGPSFIVFFIMKDRFSDRSKSYSQFRPLYPAELYEFLFSKVKDFSLAWDAGTGNGQAARELAKRFKKVYATDISEKQLENAINAENIEYAVAAESCQLAANSVDLI